MKIGDHVHIGANTVVEAAQIGSHVEIGKNCIIVRCPPSLSLVVLFRAKHYLRTPDSEQGKFTMIKDCAKIADNTVLMANSVVPALAYFEGAPGQFVSDLPESTQEMVEAETKAYYERFKPIES